MIELPLNNYLTTFAYSYLGYVNVYETCDTNLIFGSDWGLKSTYFNKSSLTADLSGNNIIFSPTIVEDENNFWFIKDETGNYVPQKRVITTLYQQSTTNINDIFEFKGNIVSNTLQTKYGSVEYTINAFIGGYKKDLSGNFILLDEVNSPLDNLGDFAIQLDTTNSSDITHLQWGFKISGYPVYSSEAGSQGSVTIGSKN
jgi:hypothetical protein